MDLIHNEKHYVSLPAAAYTKAGGAVDGSVVNTQMAERVLIQAFSGDLGAQANVYPIELFECATSNGSFTAVADSDMIPISGAEPSFDQSIPESNSVKLFEYVGSKLYLKAHLDAPTGAGTGSGIVGVNIILGGLRHSVPTP
jgi:hypothetical protein